MPASVTAKLDKSLESVLKEGHPWVYRDAVPCLDAAPGAAVTLLDKKGRFVARGYAEEGSIAVRVLTTRDEPVDTKLWRRRVARAVDLRRRVRPEQTSAYRLIHGEGDRLPGIVVDVYGPAAVLRLDGVGAAALRPEIVDVLREPLEALGVASLMVRTGRRDTLSVELAFGPEPETPLPVTEHSMVLLANLRRGQKTGLFLDHRESRRRVRELSAGARVMNLYAYTGGFSVAAGLGGASHVTTVDVAKPAIELAERTWEANGLDPARHDAVAEDVPRFLASQKRMPPLDFVIADPPSFAPHKKALPKAVESYRALHAACLRRVVPGGLYLAASCSSHIDSELFSQTVREGARRAGRVLQVLERWGAPADHPRLLAFPEGDYLKVLLTRVSG